MSWSQVQASENVFTAAELARMERDVAAAPDHRESESNPSDLSRTLKLSVPVMVVLAEQEMAIKSILEMTVGTIVEFNVPFDAPLELRVANQTIGRGNAIKIGENFGLRISAIDPMAQRVDAMGGG